MLLNVRTLTDEYLIIEVDDVVAFTVRDLKLDIQKKYDHPVATQKLIFCGEIMDDNRTLASYEVQKEACIHIVIKKDQQAPTSQASDADAPRKRVRIEDE